MKYYMVFVCVALASINFKSNCFPSRQAENPCHDQPNGSFLNHPLGCKYFIVCNNGEVNMGSCPDGLAFNPLRPPCDLEANVDCSTPTTTEITTTESTTTQVTTAQPTTTQPTTTQPTTTQTTTTQQTTTQPTTTQQTTTQPTTTQPTTTQSTTTQSTTTQPTTTQPTTTQPTTTQSTTTQPTTTQPTTTPATTTQSTTTQSTTTTRQTTTTTLPPTTTPLPTTTIANTQPPTSTTVRPVTPDMPDIPETLKCPDEDPNRIVFLASNTHCSKYYICYHDRPIEMTCSPNLHWNIKTQKCDTIEEAKCTVSTMPSFFPVCPRDAIGMYPHPLNCEWFLYCYLGHMTVQQCPFFYNWDSDTQSCQLKTVAKCVLYSA